MRAASCPVPRRKGGAYVISRATLDVSLAGKVPRGLGLAHARSLLIRMVSLAARLTCRPLCVAMLCRSCAGWLRSLPTLRLRAPGSPLAWSSARLPALPVWAAASVSAASPSSWYEALAASAPVRTAEEVLLGAHEATGLPWWGSIILTTVALRGAVTLPLAAYQHYILAKVRGVGPRAAYLLVLIIEAASLLK